MDKTPKEIATTALSLWDMHAEDAADERALMVAVARGLIAFGLEKEDAAASAALVNLAVSAHGQGIDMPDEIARDPVYQAAAEELRSGNWGFE
jgi:hypothetical protein